MYACVRACVCVFVCVRERERVCVCLRACVSTVRAFVRVFVRTCVRVLSHRLIQLSVAQHLSDYNLAGKCSGISFTNGVAIFNHNKACTIVGP